VSDEEEGGHENKPLGEHELENKLTRVVRSRAESMGVDIFGVADPFSPLLQAAPDGHRPQDYLSGANSVVVLGMVVLEPVLHTTPSTIYSKHYDTINECLNAAAYGVAKFLQRRGHRSIYFPETDSYRALWRQYDAGYQKFIPSFNHMAAAEAAGLGKKGICGVLLTPKYGPRVRWISVITEAPLVRGNTLSEEVCLEKIRPNTCQKCVKSCPIGAISVERGTDVRRCWIYWNQLRDMGSACGICIKSCPVGK
jgi:epoxyqueuosine reductase QueG